MPPLGDRRKSDFQRKALGHSTFPLISGEAELTGLFTDAQSLAPRVSVGAWHSLAAGLPALPCSALPPVPCTLWGINGIFSLSGVRAALKALYSEWSHLCPEPRAHHRFLPDHWRMQGNFHLPA